MRIGIIGYGFVGQAISFAHRTDDIVVRDPKLRDSASLDQFVGCDAIFVCVPSPSTATGHCDSSILEQTLKELLFVNLNHAIPIICKTTATPEVYERLHKEYPNIVHCPEFLTAANHIADYQNSSYFVLGGSEEWCIKARMIINHGVPLVHQKFLQTDIKTAALYKYMMNSYLATKVTFMNDFKLLADAEGINFKNLTDLSIWDDRIGYTHKQVPGNDGKCGWGGDCFPKDISAIIKEAEDLGADLELLGHVQEINKKHRQL